MKRRQKWKSPCYNFWFSYIPVVLIWTAFVIFYNYRAKPCLEPNNIKSLWGKYTLIFMSNPNLDTKKNMPLLSSSINIHQKLGEVILV